MLGRIVIAFHAVCGAGRWYDRVAEKVMTYTAWYAAIIGRSLQRELLQPGFAHDGSQTFRRRIFSLVATVLTTVGVPYEDGCLCNYSIFSVFVAAYL